jgi:hypothetical protein
MNAVPANANAFFSPTTNPVANSVAVSTHVLMLQGIISRLATNSAYCKTWCLTLIAALVSLAGATHTPGLVQFTLAPLLIFGLLDMRYLAREREEKYSLDAVYNAQVAVSVGDFLRGFISWSTGPVYGALVVVYVIAQVRLLICLPIVRR